MARREKIDITNKKFGKLTVLKFVEKRGSRYYWLCKCDCGTEKEIGSNHLKDGGIVSCGCYKKIVSVTHGESGSKPTPEYKTWTWIKIRCCNKNNEGYKKYGAKGIKICDRWKDSFENFLADMGRRPSSEYSIDRHPDKYGNYEPSNCRWATVPQQVRNKTNNVWYSYDGKEMILSDWLRYLKIKDWKYRRLIKKKSFEQIVSGLELKNQLESINKKYATHGT